MNVWIWYQSGEYHFSAAPRGLPNKGIASLDIPDAVLGRWENIVHQYNDLQVYLASVVGQFTSSSPRESSRSDTPSTTSGQG